MEALFAKEISLGILVLLIGIVAAHELACEAEEVFKVKVKINLYEILHALVQILLEDLQVVLRLLEIECVQLLDHEIKVVHHINRLIFGRDEVLL